MTLYIKSYNSLLNLIVTEIQQQNYNNAFWIVI